MKSQRIFSMSVQGAQTSALGLAFENVYTFSTPLTLELDIHRGLWQSVSDGVFRIYNLAESTRSAIYQDFLEQSQLRQITLKAGYLSWTQNTNVMGPTLPLSNNALASSPLATQYQSLPTIFSGNIVKAYSIREGPNWVTNIEAWDGGFGVTQGNVSLTVPANATIGYIIQQLQAAMPSVLIGYVDKSFFDVSYSQARGRSLTGSPWQILSDIAGYLYADLFIDLGYVYLVKKGQSIPNLNGGLQTIDSQSGLLDTPMKQGTICSFEMMFEPRLKVGQAVNLQSLETVNNGVYTVGGISHVGTISNAVGGDLRTRVECFYSPQYQPAGAIQ